MTPIPPTTNFDIVFTSDLHGAIRPIHYNTNAYRPAGLAMLASLIRQERERSPELLLIDNGDLLQGSPLHRMRLHTIPRMESILSLTC